jgi:hypothetical protein
MPAPALRARDCSDQRTPLPFSTSEGALNIVEAASPAAEDLVNSLMMSPLDGRITIRREYHRQGLPVARLRAGVYSASLGFPPV